MGKTVALAGLCLLASTAAFAGRAGPGAFKELYVAPPVTELLPGEVPEGASTAAALTAARGEREGFFVVLRGSSAAPAAKDVSISALRGEAGTLAADRARVWRAAWVEVDGRKVADALVPLELSARDVVGVFAGAQEDLVLYVELDVPRDAAPGHYRGMLRVAMEGTAAQVPISLRVLEAQLPARASLRSAFGFSAREALLGSGSVDGEDALGSVARRYALRGLSHRITLIGGTGRAPAFHQTPGAGDASLDFRAFDDEVADLMEGVPSLDGAAATAIALRIPRGLGAVEAFKYRTAFERHLRQKGWADRLVSSDEATCAISECLEGTSPSARWLRLGRTGAGGLDVGAPRRQIRAIGWWAYAAGAEGLRYDGAVDGFGGALWNGALARGALFYPLRSDVKGTTVVESVRLKLLRDGLEDYELLRSAGGRGHAGLARGWVKKVAPNAGEVTADPSAWDQARRSLSEALHAPRRRAP